MSDVAAFAADLIRFDTTNRGGGDGCERPAAEYVAARLSEAGLEPVLLESAKGRANVVARIAGRRPGNALLLHGHLDVVPAEPADGWCTRSPVRSATACCGAAARSI